MILKNLRPILLLILLFSGINVFSAYGYEVKGLVTEESGESMPYVTIKIFSSNDSITPVNTFVSKSDGTFSQTIQEEGTYTINIVAIGKTPFIEAITLEQNNPVADLGTIVMEAGDNVLKEVTVTGLKPIISMEVDRIGYDVQADEESKTAMTDEILRKVPLVSVDPDGTIKVNGSTDYKIYKNGRPNNGFTRNAKELFKVLPASMIEKIEVITEPGAREDAEGTTVILNIITMKNTVITGLMGGASVNYTTPNYYPNPSLWLQAQYDKFLVSAYGGYSHTNGKRDRKESVTDTYYFDTDNHQHSTNRTSPHGSSGYFGIEASWEPDTLNLFTFDIGGFVSGSGSDSYNTYQMEDGAGNLLYKYNSNTRTLKSNYHSIYGSANYQRSTRKKGESIILSYRLYTNKNYGQTQTDYEDMINMPVPYTGIYTDNNEVGSENTVQMDWTRPINKSNSFDIGTKYVNRNNHSESFRDYIGWEANETDFKHITQIGAIFADYRFNLQKFGIRAGIRYEFSRLDAKYPKGGGNNFHSNLYDWVPNVGISFSPNYNHSFRLNWGTTINRPGITYLNPQVSESPNFTSYGNPDLESVRRNSLSFSYTMIVKRVTMSLSANYSFANNDIINFQWVEGDHTYSTYGNLGRFRGVSPYLYIYWRPSAKTTVTGNFSLNYVYNENPSMNQRNDGWGYNLFGMVTQRLPWNMTFSFYATMSRTPNSLYTRGVNRSWSNLYYNISLSKSFLKEDRLTVRIAVTDPIHYKTPGYTDYTSMENLYQVTEHYRFYRTMFSVGVSYRFGTMKASVKKVRSIANGDVVGGNSQE